MSGTFRGGAFRVGAFLIDGPLGRGGMGTVWAGRHAASDLPVAVKTISAEHGSAPALQAAFQREVRAVAGLDHPHVVRVFDQGRVTAAEAAGAGGALAAGAPWLAMEQVDGGALSGWCGTVAWDRAATALRELLAALACAHAHGVLHRDIKPANVLIAAPGHPRPGVRLTDFGLAHAVTAADAAESGRLAAGTPAWMPPEQAVGAWRDQGPWTDLFAVGRLAWALVTGAPRGRSGGAGGAVPGGLEAWVARCCMPEPADRFAHAADAARALDDVDWTAAPGGGVGAGPAAGDAGSQPTLDLWGLGADPGDDGATSGWGEGSGPGGAGATSGWGETILPGAATATSAPEAETTAPAPRPPPPPLPRAWRQPGSEAGVDLAGAGLGLLGLRPVPFSGREAERDALWQALHAVRGAGEARAVVLRGPAGVGKSRLAEWAATRAAETGAVAVFRATHDEDGGAADGLAAMLRRHLALQGLDAERALGRVAARLPAAAPREREQVARALVGALELPGLDVRFSRPAERHDVLLDALLREAGERVALVWLDDAHWGPDALAFAGHVLARLGPGAEEPRPVLLLLTVREEAVAELPGAAGALAALEQAAGGSRLDVPALDEAGLRRVVGALPGLADDLVDQLVARAGGSPLFAVHLVTDWVQRGLLELGPDGFALVDGATPDLPDDLFSAWSQRLDRLLAALPPGAEAALERAAALGVVVDDGEWAGACGPTLAATRAATRAALGAAGLARRAAVEANADAEEAWAFAHGMVRDCVLQRSRHAGRLPGVHRDCAEALPGRARAERRGRHLREAGHPREAAESFLLAVESLLRRGEPHRARAVLALARETAAGLSLSPDDSLALRLSVTDCRLARLHRDLDTCFALGREIAARARAAGLTALAAEALGEVGAGMRLRRGESARPILLEAAALAEESGSARVRLHALIDLTYVDIFNGDGDAALARLPDLHALAADHGEPLERGDCLRLEAQLHRQRGDHPRTLARLDEAVACFEEAGYRAGLADLENIRGDVLRLAGRLDEAAEAYRRGLQICERIVVGHRDPYPRINLAQVDLQRGAWDRVVDALAQVRADVVAMDNRALVGVVDVLVAVARTGRGQGPAALRALAEGERWLREAGFHDVDVIAAAAQGAELAGRGGHAELAEAFEGLRAWQQAALEG